MLKVKQREKWFYGKSLIFLTLSICCNCTTLRAPPKITKCLADFNRGGLDCINSSGTEFFLKFSDKDIDKHICIPGKQFIDATAWLQELIIVMTKGK